MPKNREAGVARGKCALTFDCGWKLRRGELGPGPAILSYQQFEFEISLLVWDGIAEDNSMRSVPEDH